MMNMNSKVNVNMNVLRSSITALIARQLEATGQDPSQADAITDQVLSCGNTARGEFDACIDRETECRLRAMPFPAIFSRNAVIKDVSYETLDDYGVLLDIAQHMNAFSSTVSYDETMLTRTADTTDRVALPQIIDVIGFEVEIQLPKDIVSASGWFELSQLQDASGNPLYQRVSLRVEGNSATFQLVPGWMRTGATRNLPRSVQTGGAKRNSTETATFAMSGFPVGALGIVRYGTVHNAVGQSILRSVAASIS